MCGGEHPDREQRSAPEVRGPLSPEDPTCRPQQTEVVLEQIGRGQERGQHPDGDGDAGVGADPAGRDQRCAHDERTGESNCRPAQTEGTPERDFE